MHCIKVWILPNWNVSADLDSNQTISALSPACNNLEHLGFK